MLDSPSRALEVLAGRSVVALTGAGLSTDSGIPDYRGPGSPRAAPMTITTFRSGEAARRRYWARSYVGWTRIWDTRPNAGHRALARLEDAGVITGLITQNVDGLHAAAGSRELVELHGRLADVVCLDCHRVTPRAELQHRLAELNPGFAEEHGHAVVSAPDGDARLESVDGFRLAPCEVCLGPLKPDVVFFGETVPPERVDRCRTLLDALAPTGDGPGGRPGDGSGGRPAGGRPAGGALLVAGSSLAVYSGLRFVRHAHALGLPVVIVNRGATRGDPLAALTVDAGCSETLTTLADALT